MTDPRIVRANTLVDRATTKRLEGDIAASNELLRFAADLYHEAGEFGEAQTCRMLIVSDVSLPHGQSCACSECLMKYETTFKPAAR